MSPEMPHEYEVTEGDVVLSTCVINLAIISARLPG